MAYVLRQFIKILHDRVHEAPPSRLVMHDRSMDPLHLPRSPHVQQTSRVGTPWTARQLSSVQLKSPWTWGAGGSGVGYWTLDPKVQGSNPWGTGRWGLAAPPSLWLWRRAVPPASGPHTYRKNSKPGQCTWNICSAFIHTKQKTMDLTTLEAPPPQTHEPLRWKRVTWPLLAETTAQDPPCLGQRLRQLPQGGGGAWTAEQPKPQHCVVNLSIKTYKRDSSVFPWQRQNIVDGKNDVPQGLGITMTFCMGWDVSQWKGTASQNGTQPEC